MNKLQVIADQLNKKFGAGTLIIASEAKGLSANKFSTGSLLLDIALGGGFAEGRMNELVGQYSTYKTTLAIRAATEFLRRAEDRYIVWIDMERSFDKAWVKHLGADPEKFLLLTPDSGEQAVNTACDILKNPRGHVLLVLDSIAALIPMKEVEDNDAKGIGTHPRLVSKMVKRFNAIMKSDLVTGEVSRTVLFLNQARVNIGMLYGDPETSPGGRALEHFGSIKVRLRRKEYIYEQLTGDIKRSVGAKIGFRVLKNKTGGASQETGIFTFYNSAYSYCDGGEIDNIGDILPWALAYEVVEKSGNTFRYGKIKGTGKEAFCGILHADAKATRTLAREVLKAHRRAILRKTGQSSSNDVSKNNASVQNGGSNRTRIAF